MIERLTQIIRTKNINASKFADEIGVQRSNVSHVLSGRNKPSLEFVLKVLERFPEIKPDWLLFGKSNPVSGNVDLFSEEPALLKDEVTKEPIKSSTSVDSERNETANEDETQKYESKKTVKKIMVLYSDMSYEEFSPKP
jgi:transcriptional regulator with XRE-family HTH domain